MNSFYTDIELNELGFKRIGNNNFISRKASFYSIELISIGSNVRIDDFCIISGEITIGSYVHISAYSALYGSYGIVLEDYTGLSPRCTIFSATDDFSGEYLVGPMCENRNLDHGCVRLKKFSQVGAGSIIMPNITVEEGAVVGAMSFVKDNLEPWSIYTGIPARFLKARKENLKKLL